MSSLSYYQYTTQRRLLANDSLWVTSRFEGNPWSEQPPPYSRPSGIPFPFATPDLPLTTYDGCSPPPHGRLDGNCPSEQVAEAIPGRYAANYSPIHKVPVWEA